MNHNDTQVSQLILNLIENRSDFETMMSNGLNANELYFVSNDNSYPVESIDYDTSGTPKFTYTKENGTVTDIITLAALKNAFNLSSVASDGAYTSLSSKPQINGVELTGNKTTADLGISLNYTSDAITNKPQINNVLLTGNQTTKSLHINYGDLENLPTIPQITNDYIQGNTGAALTSAGVDDALTNYVPKTRTVTGTGALGGGGELSGNLTITHNTKPNGLATAAIKIGVDEYGHVCEGAQITPSDISAVDYTYLTTNSVTNLDISSYSTFLVDILQNETLSTTNTPKLGYPYTIYIMNNTENQITVTIPSNITTVVYVNSQKLTADYTLNIATNTVKAISVKILMSGSNTISIMNIS